MGQDAKLILVVEDDPETGELLELYLASEGYRVLRALRGDEGLELALGRSPDAILLDLMLPGVDGLELCQRVRRESDVPVLMISARTLEAERLRGFDVGADDYIAKPFSPREVVRRVRAVLRRVKRVGEFESTRVGELLLDRSRRTLHVNEQEVSLTATEFDLLALLMAAPERVFTREELIEDGLGREFDGLVRTVDAHIGNLRRKLRAAGHDSSCLQTVTGVGYRLSP